MRECGRIGCENSLDDARPDAVYCGPTCKREAARARALSRDETGKPGFWSRYSQIRRQSRCRTRDTAIVAVLTTLFLLLAGCGGTKTVTSTATLTSTTVTTTTTGPGPVQVECPPGHSYMGCAQGVSPTFPLQQRFGAKLGTTAGPKFVDVSSYQGCPDWPAIKPFIDGVAAKAGEYEQDPDFRCNVERAHAAGLHIAAYWFERPTGCVGEAQHFIAIVRAAGGTAVISRLVLDEEVSGIQGYAACEAPIIHRELGIEPTVYRSSENNEDSSGDSDSCWVAAFGPSTAPACNGRPIAWQFASPPYVYFFVPHLGYGDVNVDYGFFSAIPRPKPALVCKAFARSIPRNCLKLFPNERFGPARLNERGVVSTYKFHRRQSVHAHLVYLRDRVWFVSHHKREHGHWVKLRKPDYKFDRGFRYQRLAHDAAGR